MKIAIFHQNAISMVTIFLANLIWINYLNLLILVNDSAFSEHKEMKSIESP